LSEQFDATTNDFRSRSITLADRDDCSQYRSVLAVTQDVHLLSHGQIKMADI